MIRVCSLGPKGTPLGWTLAGNYRQGWDLGLRWNCLAHYPVLGCLPGKLKWRNLTTFYWDVTRMPCQHLKVCCVQGLSAMLKNTFTMADWLSVPAWLTVTVDELSWCHSVLASELGKYVFSASEIRDLVLFSLSSYWNRTLNFATNCRSVAVFTLLIFEGPLIVLIFPLYIVSLCVWLVPFEKPCICNYVNTDFSLENKPFKL